MNADGVGSFGSGVRWWVSMCEGGGKGSCEMGTLVSFMMVRSDVMRVSVQDSHMVDITA